MHPGLFTAHDIWHQVARLYHYFAALQDGQVFPAWISTLAQGNGYPLFLFSYHFPWFIGAVFLYAGFSIPVTLKLLFALSFFLSGVSMYALAYTLLPKKIPATAAASIYLVAPFHLLSIYVSASIGTTFFFMFLPLIFLGIYYILRGTYLRGALMLALATAAGILTHLMSLVIFVPFILVYLVVELARVAATEKPIMLKRQLGTCIGAALLVLLLTAFYMVPLLTFLPLTHAQDAGNGFSELYASNLVYFRQLLYSPWGFGPIISNAKDGEISLQVGIAQWLSIVTALVIVTVPGFFTALIDTKIIAQNRFRILSLIALFFVTCAAMTDFGAPLWKVLTQVVSIDYPFRLLTLAVFFASLLVLFVLGSIKNTKLSASAAVLFIALAAYTNRNHIRVNLYTDIPVHDYVQAETTTNTFNEYLPKSAAGSVLKLEHQPLILEGLPISNEKVTTTTVSFTTATTSASLATVRQFAFPGQELRINGVRTQYSVSKDGRILAPLSAGTSQVSVRYIPTFIQKIATVVSLLSFFSLMGTWYILVRQKKL